jgi:hypothetical protein
VLVLRVGHGVARVGAGGGAAGRGELREGREGGEGVGGGGRGRGRVRWQRSGQYTARGSWRLRWSAERRTSASGHAGYCGLVMWCSQISKG